MRIFVLGGTGAIGRPAVEALIASGHSMSALVRTDERAAELHARGAEPVRVSIFDRSGLIGAFRGHDAVINLATAQPRSVQFMFLRAWRDTERVRTDGSAAVVDAALAADIPILVQESVAMLYRDSGQEWVDETAPVDQYPMAAGNHAAEASAERFTASGGTGIVLRFGFFYGAGARHAEEFLSMARLGVVPVLGRPDSYVSSIHVDDGGRAVAAALGARAGTYNVVDDEPLTKRQYAQALSDAVNRRAWLRAPGRAALLLGHRTTSLSRSIRASNSKLRMSTDWSPRFRSAREGWRHMAQLG